MRGREPFARRVTGTGGDADDASVPVDVDRTRLYTADELYDTPLWSESLDGRGWAFSRRPATRDDAMARALHDHAIDLALEHWVRGRSVVGVMGGHALRRDEPAYADAARLGRALGAAHVVATGGGPGAMEAANLGAWCAPRPPEVLDEALAALAAVPSFEPSVDAWLAPALHLVRTGPAQPGVSLGVPTWHYGHEPPNVFATAIAKYFRNATREAVLLEICNAGIVFLPGAAGTVQEVFQDACENYYADPASVAPMVLVGQRHWVDVLPVWPLLQRLARGRDMADHVHLVDGLDEAAAVIAG